MPDLLEDFERSAAPTSLRKFQDWDRYLDAGETMLWEGFPSIRAITKKRLILVRQIGGAIIFSALFLFAIPFIETLESPAQTELARGLAFALALIGSVTLVLGPKLVNKSQVNLTYGISTTHTMVLRYSPKLEIWRFPIAKIIEVQLIHGAFDVLHFAQQRQSEEYNAYPWEGIPDTEPVYINTKSYKRAGFENLDDGLDAYHILKSAQKGLT